MTTETTDQGQDVFDDSDAGFSDTGEMANTSAGEGNTSLVEDANMADGQSQTGDEEASMPPIEGQDDEESVTDAKGQKMIPEHRFKAALKKVTDELEEKTNKLREYEEPRIEAPDKDVDPEGHDLHVRMENSTYYMRRLYTDYQEVINHYAELAQNNELLNQAVANHPRPAELAYDIAKRDLEIKEALALRESDEYKEFQTWKKSKGSETLTKEQKLNTTIARGLNSVPNLNRSTNASPNRNVRRNSSVSDDTDELFRGAL